jgi:hypothetical protein
MQSIYIADKTLDNSQEQAENVKRPGVVRY